jgi:hypothetical protein
MRHIRTAVLFAALGALASFQSAHAGLIENIPLPEGSDSSSMLIKGANVNVVASGGMFKNKTVAGFTGTGIYDGVTNLEIENEEYLLITFDKPVAITSLSIVHLFNAHVYDDLWNESAKFITDNGSFLLTATGATSADFDGFGAVTNDSPSVHGLAGAWTINGENIFGGPITSLKIMSGNPGPTSKYGDFSFGQLQFEVVPAPGALMAFGLFGLIPSRRRR